MNIKDLIEKGISIEISKSKDKPKGLINGNTIVITVILLVIVSISTRIDVSNESRCVLTEFKNTQECIKWKNRINNNANI